MKQKLLFLMLIVGLIFSTNSFSQSKFINYQGVASDDSGNVLANETITVEIALIFGIVGNAPTYGEDHSVTTDANGVFSLQIGSGNPSNGTYTNLTWGDVAAFVKTSVNGTTVGTTELHAVPFALNATKATGLEKITGGRRLVGVDQNNYGQIGNHAVDLSWSPTSSTVFGATGNTSTAMGIRTTASNNYSTAMGAGTTASGNTSTAMGAGTTASGDFSTAMGWGTTASGIRSTAMGNGTIASGYASAAMGRSTIAGSANSLAIGSNNIGGGNPNVWLDSDPLFEIGNSLTDATRNNAFTVLKNGKVGIGNHKPESVFEVTHVNGSPTSGNLTNAFSIINSDSNKSWQFHVNNLGALVLYRNGVYTSYFHETSGAYVTVSDRRLKKDITPLTEGTLQKVLQLNPVSYLMKDQTDTNRNLGLISQEVQEIFPSITHYTEESDILTLSYTELIPILIKAMQEQQEIIEGQNSKIESLFADVSAIKAMLENSYIKREVVSTSEEE